MSHFLSDSFNDRPSLSVTVTRTSSVTSVDGNSPVTPTREERQRRRQERLEALRREEEKLNKEYEQRREERKKQQESRLTKIQQEAKENEERMKKLERERSIRSLTRGNSISNSTTTSLSLSSSAISLKTSTIINPPTTATSQPTTASSTISTVPSYTYSQQSTTTAPLSMSESLSQNNSTRPDAMGSRNSPKRTVARPLSAFLDNVEISSSHSSVSNHQLNSSFVPKKSQESLATSSVSLANASPALANSGARDSLSSSKTDGKTSVSQQNLTSQTAGPISKPRSNSRLGEYRKSNLDVSFNGQESEEEEEDDDGYDTEPSQSKVDTQTIPTKNEAILSSTDSEKSTRMTNRLTSFMGARPTPINTRKPSGEALPRLSEVSPASDAPKSETTPLSSPHKVTISPIINNAFEMSDSPILPPHLASMPSSPVNEPTLTITTTDLKPPQVKSVAVANATVVEPVKQSVVPVGVTAVTNIPLTRSISVLVDSASPTSPTILNQTSTKTEKSKETPHTSSKADPLVSFNDWIETLSPSSAFTLTLMDNLPLSGSTQTVHSVAADPSHPKPNGLIDIAKFLQAREIETVPTEEPKQTQVYLIRDKLKVEITATAEKGIFYSGENYIIVAQYPTQTVIWHWKGCDFQEVC
ncbi:hypothetical protein BKA69DRAFT_1096824 [Paraphysoderma sedebokerense]|nr:hypothetical protein BKA69DRAFT_1096824 [Paraphysoderma sedebokerense]